MADIVRYQVLAIKAQLQPDGERVLIRAQTPGDEVILNVAAKAFAEFLTQAKGAISPSRKPAPRRAQPQTPTKASAPAKRAGIWPKRK